MRALNKPRLPYTKVYRGGQRAISYTTSGKAAAVLVSLMRFVGEDRRVSMPRALIAEDTGLTERQVKDAIRSLKRTAVPDPDTGRAVPLLEVLKDGHNGAATEYRLNVSNVDAVPWGYKNAAHGGVGAWPAAPTGARVGVGAWPATPTMARDGIGAEPATPTSARVGVGVEPATVGVEPATVGVATKHGRGGACHPLIDKEINKKIKEAGKGKNGEWNGKPFFRSECPVCGKQHAFMLKGPEDGAGTCPSSGGEVTAPPPDGYRIAARGGAYVLEWLRDGRA